MLAWLERLFSSPRAAPVAAGDQPMPDAQAALPRAAAEPAIPAAPEPDTARAAVSFEQKDNINHNYHGWLFDNRQDDTDLHINAQEQLVLDALDALLASQQSGADLVRRMPGLLPQVLQSLRSEHFSGAEIARKISHDMVLVAQVLRLANKATLHGGKTISSVEHAVIVLGQEGLRQLILTVALRPIIDLHSGFFTHKLAPRLWEQSERCAVACRLLAESAAVDPFDAFLAGLVQNAGLIVALRVMDRIGVNHQLGSVLFCAGLQDKSRLLARNIGQEWGFPEAVTVAIGDQLGNAKRRQLSPLGRLLTLGDYLSKVKMLVEHGRLSENQADLFKGLPADALLYYQRMDALTANADLDPPIHANIPP